MAKYYYGTQPFLAWCLNHYFYSQVHYVYLAAPFFPYKQNNPASSDPISLYMAFYRPFKDKDRYDHFIRSYRQALKAGVDSQISDIQLKKRLRKICDKIAIEFFYPIVYRVDVTRIADTRLNVKGSGVEVGSKEYLIEDLQESEFDLLFVDFENESLSTDFSKLCYDSISQTEALALLEVKRQ